MADEEADRRDVYDCCSAVFLDVPVPVDLFVQLQSEAEASRAAGRGRAAPLPDSLSRLGLLAPILPERLAEALASRLEAGVRNGQRDAEKPLASLPVADTRGDDHAGLVEHFGREVH